MKILFTGQRGFLGRELIPHLEQQGHDVTTSNIDYSSDFNVNQFFVIESLIIFFMLLYVVVVGFVRILLMISIITLECLRAYHQQVFQ